MYANAAVSFLLDSIDASDDPDVVPGEVDSGIGRFVRELAGGFSQIVVLPVDHVGSWDQHQSDRSALIPQLTLVTPVQRPA